MATNGQLRDAESLDTLVGMRAWFILPILAVFGCGEEDRCDQTAPAITLTLELEPFSPLPSAGLALELILSLNGNRLRQVVDPHAAFNDNVASIKILLLPEPRENFSVEIQARLYTETGTLAQGSNTFRGEPDGCNAFTLRLASTRSDAGVEIPDGGVIDTGVGDLGPEDLGNHDAGPGDTEPLDALGPDAMVTDSMVPDAPPSDTGVRDASPPIDAGLVDAMTPDAGFMDAMADASSDVGFMDAMTPDTGTEAGFMDATDIDTLVGDNDAEPGEGGSSDEGVSDAGEMDANDPDN